MLFPRNWRSTGSARYTPYSTEIWCTESTQAQTCISSSETPVFVTNKNLSCYGNIGDPWVMGAVYNIVIKLESIWVKEFGCFTSVILLKKKFKESYFDELKSLWKLFLGSVVIKQKEKFKQSLASGHLPDMGRKPTCWPHEPWLGNDISTMVFGNLRIWLTINTKLKWFFIEQNDSSVYFTQKTLACSYKSMDKLPRSYRLIIFCASVVFQSTSYFYIFKFIKWWVLIRDFGFCVIFTPF